MGSYVNICWLDAYLLPFRQIIIKSPVEVTPVEVTPVEVTPVEVTPVEESPLLVSAAVLILE